MKWRLTLEKMPWGNEHLERYNAGKFQSWGCRKPNRLQRECTWRKSILSGTWSKSAWRDRARCQRRPWGTWKELLPLGSATISEPSGIGLRKEGGESERKRVGGWRRKLLERFWLGFGVRVYASTPTAFTDGGGSLRFVTDGERERENGLMEGACINAVCVCLCLWVGSWGGCVKREGSFYGPPPLFITSLFGPILVMLIWSLGPTTFFFLFFKSIYI